MFGQLIKKCLEIEQGYNKMQNRVGKIARLQKKPHNPNPKLKDKFIGMP